MRIVAVAETERGVAAPHELTDLGAERRPDPQVDRRVRFAKAAETFGQARACEGADDRERHDAVRRAAQRADRVDAVAHRCEERFRVRQKGAPRVGQDDPAADALEKRRPQLLLKEWTRRLIAGCERCSVVAARVKPPRRTIATNASTWSSSIRPSA
jgi:hypothetical protein